MSSGSIKNRIEQNNTELNNVITTVESLPTFVDTSDADATSADILENKIAYVQGEKVVGTFSYESAGTITPEEYGEAVETADDILRNFLERR